MSPRIGATATASSRGGETSERLKAPRHPTQAEVDEHVLTHLPFAPWCEVCVAGRRPNKPHRTNADVPRTMPLITADYCFLKNATDTQTLSTLVMRIKPQGMMCATVVGKKGADANVIDRIARFLRDAGIHKCAYKSDQERPLIVVLEKAFSASRPKTQARRLS